MFVVTIQKQVTVIGTVKVNATNEDEAIRMINSHYFDLDVEYEEDEATSILDVEKVYWLRFRPDCADYDTFSLFDRILPGKRSPRFGDLDVYINENEMRKLDWAWPDWDDFLIQIS